MLSSETLVRFKERFDACVQAMAVTNCTVPDMESRVNHFITKLDMTRYNEYYAHVINTSEWPETVDAAYFRASSWRCITRADEGASILYSGDKK